MRILVGGFEAFGTARINPTALLIERLTTGQLRCPEAAEIRAVCLPVSFARAYERLKQEMEDFRADVVLPMGLAGGRPAIELERVAVNCMDANIPDNDGFTPRDLPIAATGEAAYFATLPLRALVEKLTEVGIPAKISNTAGLYVCNSVMYQLLRDLKGRAARAGFVHVPYLPGQEENAPSLPIETLQKALEVVLQTLAESR